LFANKLNHHKTINSGITAFILTIFTVTSHYLQNPNWFTTSDQTIDPWIYWGAGNNLPLSYQSDFSRTYYLQRYTITIPQTIFQFLFGPYWSQLALVSTHIFALSFIILQTLKMLNLNNLSIPTVLIFLSNHKFLGFLAMSYSQAMSLTLFCFIIFLLLKYIQNVKNTTAIISGFFIGLLSNAYLPHFVIAYVVAFVLIWRIGSTKIFINWFKLSIIGFIIAQIIIQIINFFVAKEHFQIVIFKHLYYGFNLSSKQNPWGGDGFFWFWSKGVFAPASFYWSFFILIAVFLIFSNWLFKNISDFNIYVLNLTAIGTFLGMFLFSFGKTNIVGYSWFSCLFYWILIPCVIYILRIVPIFVVWIITCLYMLIHFYGSGLMAIQIVDTIDSQILPFMVIVIIVLGLITIYFFKPKFRLLYNFAVFSIIIILIQSSFFIFSEGGIPEKVNAKSVYESTNSARSGLNFLLKKYDRRIWLTPLESMPLQSSMLYMYSLVSTDSGKENCEQVNWMNSSKSLLVVTDSNLEKEKIVEDTFLIPCGVVPRKWKHLILGDLKFSYLETGLVV